MEVRRIYLNAEEITVVILQQKHKVEAVRKAYRFKECGAMW